MLKNGFPSLLLSPLPPVPVMTEAGMAFRRKGTYFQAKYYINISSKITTTTISIGRRRGSKKEKEENEEVGKKKRRKKKRINQEIYLHYGPTVKYSTRISLSEVLYLTISLSKLLRGIKRRQKTWPYVQEACMHSSSRQQIMICSLQSTQ